jgi:hypothetical protein
MPKMKGARLEARQRLLTGYEGKGSYFLYSIVTGDGELGASLRPRNEKPVTIVTPLLP